MDVVEERLSLLKLLANSSFKPSSPVDGAGSVRAGIRTGGRVAMGIPRLQWTL